MRNMPVPILILAVVLGLTAISSKKPEATPPRAVPVEKGMVLYDFGAEWCGPCKSMERPLQQLEDCGGRVTRIDVDRDSSSPAMKYHSGGNIPEFVAVKDGKVVDRHTGIASLEKLKGMVGIAHEPTPVLDPPAPTPAKPVRSVLKKPVFGPDGWRLRLFYPPGDSYGEEIKANLTRMPAIAAKYGFQAFTTDTMEHDRWVRCDCPKDGITLVLVTQSGRIVYRNHNPSRDAIELREEIREAARKSWESK